MTGLAWRKCAEERLNKSGDADAAVDAKLFLACVLRTELSRLPLAQLTELTDEQLNALESMLVRRESGEPEQYIEGRAWFMGLEFAVDSRVLIPRQDTETLCEFALEEIKTMKRPEVLDLCTGSGALAVAIKSLRPDSCVTAADISADALCVAEENARRNGAEVERLCGDGFAPLRGRTFDLIVCNPPYLTRDDMSLLQTEVRREPSLALYGGEDGLDLYRRFISELSGHLNAGGKAAFEVGMGQAEAVLALLKERFPDAEMGTVKDLNDIDRVVYLRTK